MLAGLANNLGKERLVKNRLISTLDKVFKGTFLQGSKNLSLLHKIGRRPAEKIGPFFSTCVFYI
jgi:hypothetical protein